MAPKAALKLAVRCKEVERPDRLSNGLGVEELLRWTGLQRWFCEEEWLRALKSVWVEKLSRLSSSALAPAIIMTDSGGGVIFSKYEGLSHSPRKASSRRIDFRIGGGLGDGAAGLTSSPSPMNVGRERGLGTGDGGALLAGVGLPNGVESWARPALMAIEVWIHRRNGEL